MSDFQTGDVVVCVDAKPRPYSDPSTLQDGRCYRVCGAGIGPRSHRPAVLLSGYDPRHWFTADRFRKIEAPKTELSERIKSCKPIPVQA